MTFKPTPKYASAEFLFLDRLIPWRMVDAILLQSPKTLPHVWEIVRDRAGIGDETLFEKLREIDLRDGALHGKNQAKSTECPSCKRRLSNRHAKCLYCGYTFEKSTFEL